MINIYKINLYCCEDISLIENYEQAIKDEEKTWDCHHRLETDLKLSVSELKASNMYYNRPACELIFLKHGEHMCIHHKGKRGGMYGKQHSEESKRKMSEVKKGEKNPMYGKKCGMYGKQHSEEAKKKQSDSKKGEKNPMYGKNPEDFMSPEAIKEKRRKQGEKNKGKHRVYRDDGTYYMSL